MFGVHGAAMQQRNGYSRGKAHQERALSASSAPVALVRSTQWFEIAEAFLTGRIGPVALVPHMRSQPVAAANAARAMVDAVEQGCGGGVERRVAGPEVRDIADLARALAAKHGAPRRVLAFPIPGANRLFAADELPPAPTSRRAARASRTGSRPTDRHLLPRFPTRAAAIRAACIRSHRIQGLRVLPLHCPRLAGGFHLLVSHHGL